MTQQALFPWGLGVGVRAGSGAQGSASRGSAFLDTAILHTSRPPCFTEKCAPTHPRQTCPTQGPWLVSILRASPFSRSESGGPQSPGIV